MRAHATFTSFAGKHSSIEFQKGLNDYGIQSG